MFFVQFIIQFSTNNDLKILCHFKLVSYHYPSKLMAYRLFDFKDFLGGRLGICTVYCGVSM